MLTGPRLGDDARLAHPPRQQGLSDAVIDLMRTGMVQVFTLQVDAGAAGFLSQPFGEIQRRRPADVLLQVISELALKLRIFTRLLILLRELPERGHECFRHVTAAVGTETTVYIGNGRNRIRHEDLARQGLVQAQGNQRGPMRLAWSPLVQFYCCRKRAESEASSQFIFSAQSSN